METFTASSGAVALAALFVGLALSVWLPRRQTSSARKSDGLLSWNLAALAALAAILLAGTENGGMARQFPHWWPVGSVALIVGLLIGRFPRSTLGTIVFVAGSAVALVAVALAPFHPVTEAKTLEKVQPLTSVELTQAFRGQVDLLTLPAIFQDEPSRWYRIRSASSPPLEVWWNAAALIGWARTVVLSPPEPAHVLDVYELKLVSGNPQWKSKSALWELPSTP